MIAEREKTNVAHLEIKQSLFGDRKIIKLANELDEPRATAAGIVIAIWLWAIDHAPNGDLGSDFREYVRDITGEDEDADLLMDALQNAQWIAFHENDLPDGGSWHLVGWDGYLTPITVMMSANTMS